MSKRKGLSFEEKRERMLEIFYERKDVFQLKELEKICPKEKGIISQSVKEVLTSLCDDGMVDTDKIGTSIYFWAFPSKALNTRKRKIEELENKIKEQEAKKSRTENSLKKERDGKEDSEERKEVLQKLESVMAKNAEIESELERLREFDPAFIKDMKKERDVALEGANRWTDNVFALKSWCKNKFNVEESLLNKQFDIPEDFDYLEA